MVAFVGRYGHQPLDAVLQKELVSIYLLAELVGELMQEEEDSLRSRRETDG